MNHWKLDKELVLNMGVNAALMYAVVQEYEKGEEEYHWQGPDGWFLVLVESVKMATGLSAYMQGKSLKELADAGLLETRVTGMPPLRYVRFKNE